MTGVEIERLMYCPTCNTIYTSKDKCCNEDLKDCGWVERWNDQGNVEA